MNTWVYLVVGSCVCAVGCAGESDSSGEKPDGPSVDDVSGSPNDSSGESGRVESASDGAAVTEQSFTEDDTFVSVTCPAFNELCACNADKTSCPGNEAALDLYSCLWYAADFGDDGNRSGISESTRTLEGTDERFCRTMDTPGFSCPGRMTTVFGTSDGMNYAQIWEFLDPKPTSSAALVEACEGIQP